MEFKHQGRTYTIIEKGATNRDLTVSEIIGLLPAALELASTASEQIKQIKAGKKPAIAIAQISQEAFSFIETTISKADIPQPQAAITAKVMAYAKGTSKLVLEIEK